MSQNTVTFKVAGGDLLSYFDQVKKRSNELTNSLIAGAKSEESASKNQVKLIEQQLAAMERKARLSQQLSGLMGGANAKQRIENVDNRDARLDAIHYSTEQRYKNKEITKGEYDTRIGRLSNLSNQNSPEAITGQFKDYLNKQKEQTNYLQLQTKLSREQISTAKDNARENVQAIIKGDRSLEDVISKASTPTEVLAANLTKERIDEINNKKKDNGLGDSNALKSLLGGVFGISTITGLISNVGKFAQTQNGFDLIAPAEELKGRLLGTTIGAAAGAIVGSLVPGVGTIAGTMAGSAAGSAIGSVIGSTEGEFIQRRAMAMQDYEATRNRYFATTGTDRNSLSTGNMSDIGISDKDFISAIRNMARTAGSNKYADRETSNQIYLEKGYGVDSGTSGSLVELLRSSKEQNRNVGALVAGIMERGKTGIFKGGDMSFLNEFLGKFASLQKTLLQTNKTVDSGNTFGLLNEFNNIGGYFAARDSRSSGLINQINSSLINPQGDGAQGMAFMALRRANPDMSSYDLKKEQQRGLGSQKYFSSVVDSLDNMGGDENYKKFQFASMMGLSGNLEASEDLYKHRHDSEWLKRKGGIENFETDLSGAAKTNTTSLEKSTADLSNAILRTVQDNVTAMKDAFSDAMKEVAGKFILIQGADGRFRLQETPAIQKNVTKSPTRNQRDNGLTADDKPDMRSGMNRF